MKMNWQRFIGMEVNVIFHENFGLVIDPSTNTPIYEIVFKSGRLTEAYDDGILLETDREGEKFYIFVTFSEVKCIEVRATKK